MLSDVARQRYPFSLPDLPYAYDALEPHFDRQTMLLHHRQHHATYVKKLNEALVKDAALQQLTLTDLLRDAAQLPDAVRSAVVNNGGGHVLHALFWESLTPAAAKAPAGAFAAALNVSFGSFDEFRRQFSEAATVHFGSGWVALTVEHATKKLAIEDLKDHAVPRLGEKSVVLILDVWEHAYYLKFQNRRPEFIEAFWAVINWQHAGEIFANATSAQ